MAPRGEPFSSQGHASEPPKRRVSHIYKYERKTEANRRRGARGDRYLSRPSKREGPDVLGLHVGAGPWRWWQRNDWAKSCL